MSIKEEFDKAFTDNMNAPFPIDVALLAKSWMLMGALWMAEKTSNHITEEYRKNDFMSVQDLADSITKLSKELE